MSHYLRFGELDLYVLSRVNFIDLRSGIYAFQPGEKLDHAEITEALKQAHLRGLIVYATVNCGVPGAEYDKVLGTFRELLDLGADEVVSEEFEAAREIFTRALKKYHLPETEIAKIVGKIQNWGYSKFIKNGDTPQAVAGMDTVLLSLRIHMLTVEPGSAVEGKAIADLCLKENFGIADYGLRREDKTVFKPAADTCLRAGDALIVFITDQTAGELSPLFSGKTDIWIPVPGNADRQGSHTDGTRQEP